MSAQRPIVRPNKLATIDEILQGVEDIDAGNHAGLLRLASACLQLYAFVDNFPSWQRLPLRAAASTIALSLGQAEAAWQAGNPLESWLGWKRPKSWRNRTQEMILRPMVVLALLHKKAAGVKNAFDEVAEEFPVSAKTAQRWFYEDMRNGERKAEKPAPTKTRGTPRSPSRRVSSNRRHKLRTTRRS